MSYPRIILGVSSTQIYKDDDNLNFYNNNANVLSINNNGNVGIGRINPSSKLDVNGDVIISGDLTINGDVVSVNTSTISVEDSMIKLSVNNTNDNIDSGFYNQYVDNGITKFSGLFRDSSNGDYSLFTGLQNEPTNTVNISGTGFNLANLRLNNLSIGHNSTSNARLHLYSTDYTTGIFENNGSGIAMNIDLKSNRTSNGNLTILSSKTTNNTITTGLYSYLSDSSNEYGQFKFYTKGSDGYNNRLTINEDGKIGINIDSPTKYIDIYDTTSNSTQIQVQNTNASGRAGLVLKNSNNNTFVLSNSSGNVTFLENNAGTLQYLAKSTGNHLFTTTNNNTSRMIILNNGNIGIGLEDPSYQLELSTDSAAKPTTSTWDTTSDRRVKENIVNADLDICYDDIKSIPLRRFKWSDKFVEKYQVKDKHNLGFIAQEVEKINKSCVNTFENKYFKLKDFKTLNKDQLMMSLFGAVKKLQNINEISQIEKNNKNDIIHNSLYEKIENFTDALTILKELKLFKYIDKNFNKNDLSEEEKLYLYGIDDESLKKYFNILTKGENEYLPTINRNGKIVDNEIELYNHQLNKNEEILIEFIINDNKYKKVVKVTEILDTTHILIDLENIKHFHNEINNKKIFIYGKKIENYDYLNLKFLYSLISFSIKAIKESHLDLEEYKNFVKNKLNIQGNRINDLFLKLENTTNFSKKLGENFNKLVTSYTETNKDVNIIKQENELLKKQVALNQKNINLLNQHINKQTQIINQLLQKK